MEKIGEILDEIEDMLDSAQPVMFKNDKVSIDKDVMLDLISDLRRNIPKEVKQAQIITFDSERVIKAAENKAENIIRNAEEKARELVASDTITKEARQKATEILSQAQTKTKEVRAVTSNYVDNMLAETEKFYAEQLKDVRRRRQEINNAKK